MEHLKEITKQIWEELADSQKYIKCAEKWNSDMYYELSKEELEHAKKLHSEGTDYVEAHKNEDGIAVIWEWETEKIKDMMRDVMVLQEMYKD